jgi:hypothetical protein
MRDIPRKPKLTSQQIEYCLLHMLLVPELFDYARQHLRPSDFSQASEMFYATLWDCVLTVAARNGGKLPEQLETVLQMELADRLNKPREFGLSPEDTRFLMRLWAWIFGFDRSKLDPEFCKGLLQDLIIERTVLNQMGREIGTYREVGRPVDILGSLEQYHRKLQIIMADATSAGATAFPINYKPKKLGKFPTQITWLDVFMNGGQAPGEVYVLLGPTGLGKTTISINITVETARFWNEMLAAGKIGKRKVSCFFSWEQDLERLRYRFWSYAAKIDSARLEAYADEVVQLSTMGQLQDYEKELYASDIKDKGIENVRGEFERLRDATIELNEGVHIFDFSGAADNPHVGEGGMDEVVNALNARVKEGYEIGVVVLDYANACVRKFLSARGEDLANMRLHLGNFCNEARFKIALPFNCPVWILNQLNTEANRRAPTAQQHHSYASECGNFAENAWFAFVFGTKDKANNTCQLFCTKERRAKGDRPPAVLKIHGNICTMEDVANTYAADTTTRSIIPKSMARTRSDPTAMRARVDGERPGASNMIDY